MNDYEFILRFRLPNATDDGDQYLDALFEAGCDDATVGVGIPGTIALDFCRQADSAGAAIQSAISDVLSAIPGATLVEVGPDLLNLTELADVFSQHDNPITRQAMRKYAMNQTAKAKTPFPPAAIGNSSPLWHLHDAVTWMVDNEKVDMGFAHPLMQTAQAAMVVNATVQRATVENLFSATAELAAVARETEKLLLRAQTVSSNEAIPNTNIGTP